MDELGRDRSGDDLAELVNRATIAAELADPDVDESAVSRSVNRLVESAGVILLATIVALVFGNAVGRYTLSTPILWSEEVVVALMPWLAMSGVFLSVRRRQLIKIEYFVSKMPPAVAAASASMAYLLSSAIFVYFAYVSLDLLSLFGNDRTIYLRLPRGWFISAFSVGAVAVALAFIANALGSSRRCS